VRTGKKVLLGAGAGVAALVAWFLSTFSASPLPAPAPYAGDWPPAAPPREMKVFALPTGATHRHASSGYRGGSFFEKRDFAMTAVLVRHPRGDLMIDTGFGRDIDMHFKTLPAFGRALTTYSKGTPAADQLAAAGYERRSLRAVIVTHAHWDHVSGVADLPGTPIWVTPEEHRFITGGAKLTELARSLPGARWEEYALDGGPYLGFPRSHDVYGDGAIVIVPVPGHTPGSVAVFLSLPDGKHYALVGDLVWQREGISEREERPWVVRAMADLDPAGVRDNILRVAALTARFPDLVVVPAHDARGFAAMPRFPGN
jgi:glyoxylase-like metal-dependent hydrolase (beta-lactamase superfamily II)